MATHLGNNISGIKKKKPSKSINSDMNSKMNSYMNRSDTLV